MLDLRWTHAGLMLSCWTYAGLLTYAVLALNLCNARETILLPAWFVKADS